MSFHTYGALVALGFFLGYLRMASLTKQNGLPREIAADIAWICLLSGLAGARLLYVLFNIGYYQLYPIDILKIWQGGLVWYGGLLAAAATAAWWLRKKKVPVGLVADSAAPGVALGHAIGRLGCFMAGCCYGKACDLPWAVKFRSPESLAPQNVPLHPSQLYEAGLDFLLFLLLNLLARPSRMGKGRLAVLYVGVYSVIRFVVEFTRADERGPVVAGLTSTQWLAALIFIAALAGMFALRRKEKTLSHAG
ncbi:MAG: prolipoprotein diacylglyceryl transferase [Elusimicrobia bacterium]|nr:prolipoprotein diacylglyceryl transferase [Elusimicrobiota bacterium]